SPQHAPPRIACPFSSLSHIKLDGERMLQPQLCHKSGVYGALTDILMPTSVVVTFIELLWPSGLST
ncbi:hypothetical protein, partial [Massilia frigida]|uniref:hypothetical protein n=1 Tax=Massilia frigida TaxID=2609281 RepID=UPI001CB70E47